LTTKASFGGIAPVIIEALEEHTKSMDPRTDFVFSTPRTRPDFPVVIEVLQEHKSVELTSPKTKRK
jgi:hypothetical protein